MIGAVYKDLFLKLSKLVWFAIFMLLLIVSLIGLGVSLSDAKYDSETVGTVKKVSQSQFNNREYLVKYSYTVDGQSYEDFDLMGLKPDIGDEVVLQYNKAKPFSSDITNSNYIRLIRDVLVYIGLFLCVVAFIFFLKAPTKKWKKENIDPATGKKLSDFQESEPLAKAYKQGFKRFIFVVPVVVGLSMAATFRLIPYLFEQSASTRCVNYGYSNGFEYIETKTDLKGRKFIILDDATCLYEEGPVELSSTQPVWTSRLYRVFAYTTGVLVVLSTYVLGWWCFREVYKMRKL